MPGQPELPTVRAELTHAHHLHSIGRTLKALRPILELKEPSEVFLDLTDLTFIGPACMALTVATVRQARETGLLQRGQVIYPTSRPVRTYLMRMNAMRVLFEHEEVELEDDVERGEGEGLKECEHFASAEGCLRVAKGLASAIQDEVETDTITANSLQICLGELTENVYYHAEAPIGGFATAQTFKNSQEIELAIVDLGRGIAASLSANPEFADQFDDDVSAIHTAIKPLVTATPERNSGYGLALTRLLLEINDGRLIVWSGEGKVEFGENPTDKKVDRLPGTLVVLRLHTDRPFDLQTAYNRLKSAIEEIEGSPVEDVRPLKTNATR